MSKDAVKITTIKVLPETNEKLKKLKEQYGLRSVDAVIERLVSESKGKRQREEAVENGEEASSSPELKRKILVRDPLYSYEKMKERDGMLHYYTGFDESAIELLLRRFKEVGKSVFFSRIFFFALLQACCWKFVSVF